MNEISEANPIPKDTLKEAKSLVETIIEEYGTVFVGGKNTKDEYIEIFDRREIFKAKENEECYYIDGFVKEKHKTKSDGICPDAQYFIKNPDYVKPIEKEIRDKFIDDIKEVIEKHRGKNIKYNEVVSALEMVKFDIMCEMRELDDE
jgi:hypothetical protein